MTNRNNTIIFYVQNMHESNVQDVVPECFVDDNDAKLTTYSKIKSC